MKYPALFILCLLLGCSTADCKYNREKDKQSVLAPAAAATPLPYKTVKVFQADGSKQCAIAKGQTLEQMEKRLKGIEVFSRDKTRDGMMHIQVCGSATGWINVYEIKDSDLAAAVKLGFKKWDAPEGEKKQ